MQKFKNGKIIQNKFLDFQMYRYCSPLLDVIFFMFTSIPCDVVKHHFDDLLDHYKRELFSVLEKLDCDIKPFESGFLHELSSNAPTGLIHLLLVTCPIFGRKDETVLNVSAEMMEMIQESSVTEEARARIAHIYTEFGKRRWIPD